MECLSSYFARCLRTLLQDVIDLGDVLFKLMTTHTDGLQLLVEHLRQELLALHIAQSTMTVMIFQLIQIVILWPELSEIIILGKSIEIGKHHITLHMTGIFHTQVLRIGVGRLDLLLHLLGWIR